MKPIFKPLIVKPKHLLPAIDELFLRIAANHEREPIHVSRRTVTQEVADKMTGFTGWEFMAQPVVGQAERTFMGTVDELDQSVQDMQSKIDAYREEFVEVWTKAFRGSKSNLALMVGLGVMLQQVEHQKKLAIDTVVSHYRLKDYQMQMANGNGPH